MKSPATLLLALLLFAGCTTDSTPQTSVGPTGEEIGLELITHDGLRLQNGKSGAVYAIPGLDLTPYNKLILLTPEINFDRSWRMDINSERRMNSISGSDVEEMIDTGQRLFLEVVSRELETVGYQLVNEPGDDVLLVRPSILDVYLNAPDPDRDPWTSVYAESAGDATLVLELYDSVSRGIMVRAVDRKTDIGYDGSGWAMPRSQTTNLADARLAFQNWARMFIRGLKDAGVQPTS